MSLIKKLLIFTHNVVANQTNVVKKTKLSNEIMIYDNNHDIKIFANLINKFLIF